MNLIFCDGIIEPPTESLAFRGLCLHSQMQGEQSIFLLEAEREFQDFYYKWMKRHGMHDFIEDIIYPEDKVQGLRICQKHVMSPELVIKKIAWDNLNFILSKIPYNSV